MTIVGPANVVIVKLSKLEESQICFIFEEKMAATKKVMYLPIKLFNKTELSHIETYLKHKFDEKVEGILVYT